MNKALKVIAAFLALIIVVATVFFADGYFNHEYVHPCCNEHHESFAEYIDFHYGER